jgi:hypothetical protein
MLKVIVSIGFPIICCSCVTDPGPPGRNSDRAERTVSTEVNESGLLEEVNNSIQYCFSNERINQEIEIHLLSDRNTEKLPKRIQFKLKISSSQKKEKQFEIAGIALLSSDNESFIDESEVDPSDYFAADYLFQGENNCNVRIRIDIDKFEACLVFLNKEYAESELNDLSVNLKYFPEYFVMKKC